jgi:hypothetical protein
MPSSTSSFERHGFLRQTASDRPGEAQPVPERDIPAQPWNRVLLGALVLMLLLLAGWEMAWRDYGAQPGYRNSDSAWAQQRRRISNGEGAKAVIAGSSRVLFDVQLPVWEKQAGERPIQLALEGTSPARTLESLAADPAFTGRLLIGVSPDLFFSGYMNRASVYDYYRDEGPGQRAGHWLSQRLVEPYFAFYDGDFALGTVLERQAWPKREGVRSRLKVRKLTGQSADRNTWLWSKVAEDPAYRDIARATWRQNFGGRAPGMRTPEEFSKAVETQIARVDAAVKTMRARGVRVVFVRAPSAGEYYAYEQKHLPRAQTWDLLLARTGAPGIHFEDHPALQNYELPEWSHMTKAEAERFTAALLPLVEQAWAGQ